MLNTLMIPGLLPISHKCIIPLTFSTLYFNVENKPKYAPPKGIVSMFVDAKDVFESMQLEHSQQEYNYSTFVNILKNAVVATYMKIYSKKKNETQAEENEDVNQLSESTKKRIMRNSADKVKLDLENSFNKFILTNRLVVLIDNLQDLPFGIISFFFLSFFKKKSFPNPKSIGQTLFQHGSTFKVTL